MKKAMKIVGIVLALLLCRADAPVSAQVYPGPGAGGGSVTIGDTQVAYATAANTLGGEAGMIYTSGLDLLTLLGGVTVGSTTSAGTATLIQDSTMGGASATDNFYNVTGTFPASVSADNSAVLISATSGGDAGNSDEFGLRVNTAGTTGASGKNVVALYGNGGHTGGSGWSIGTVGETIANFASKKFIGGYFGSSSINTSSGTVIGSMSYAYSNSGTPTTSIGAWGESASKGTNKIGGFFRITSTPASTALAGLSIATGPPTGSAALVADNGAVAADIMCGRDNGTDVFCIGDGGNFQVVRTLTASGTTGARTIDLPQGSVNFAAAATTLVVTNSMAATTSLIFLTPQTADTTCTAFAAVRAAGSFTITANAACTAETTVAFWVTNTP